MQLLDRLRAVINEKGVRLIGIDGLGGAGKSTVSAVIAEQLQAEGVPVTLLHIDDFIHPRAVRYREDVPEWQCYYELQWNYGSLKSVLDLVKNEGMFSGEVMLYDKEQDCYFPQEITVPENGIMIVEGIFLQRPDLSGWFDEMIYIAVPEETRLQRVLCRDSYIGDRQAIADKYERRYFPAERFYVETCCPEQRADFVINQ